MFTKEQIESLHAKVRSGADFPRLIQDLKAIGIKSYEHFVADNSNIYYGENNHCVRISYGALKVAISENPSTEKLKKSLSIHQQGKTDYPTFCIQAAEAGVKKWISDLNAMTVTYVDKSLKAFLVEKIPTKN